MDRTEMRRVHAGTGVLRQDLADATGRYAGRINVVGFVYDLEGHLEGHTDGLVLALRVSYVAPRPALEQDNRR
jgi:hypothetical protein